MISYSNIYVYYISPMCYSQLNTYDLQQLKARFNRGVVTNINDMK